MTECPQAAPSAPAEAAPMMPDGSLDAFTRAQLAAMDAGEISESTVGLLTASAFLAGAAGVLPGPATGADEELEALIVRAFDLDPGNSAGLTASVERLRARYQYMEDAHRTGLQAAQRWLGGDRSAAESLRDLIRDHKNVSMADLGQFGIKAGGRAAGAGRPMPTSGRAPPRLALHRRALFWLAAAALTLAVNLWTFLLLR